MKTDELVASWVEDTELRGYMVDENIPDSNLLNYSEYYDEWDTAEEIECPDCYGTGLDRDEIYDCPTCYGEGYINFLSPSP